MLKLSRYLKPYFGVLLLAVALLFGQAMLDLNLPNMMGRIVNVGIQKSGIEDIAPRLISGEMMDFLTLFMDETDGKNMAAAYLPIASANAKKQEAIEKFFPGAAKAPLLVLSDEPEVKAKADTAMNHASGSLLFLMQEMAKANGQQFEPGGQNTPQFDMQRITQAISQQLLPQNMLTTAVAAGKNTPEVLSGSVAGSLNLALFKQLGANTAKMQSSFIARTGATMALLSLAMVICAVFAGYFFAKIGSGVALALRRDIFAKVSAFSSAEMDKFSTSSLITRTTNDVTQVQMLYTMGMRMLVFAPIMGIGGIVMALRKSPKMSWIIAAGVAVILIIIGFLVKVVMPRFKKMQKLVDRLNLVARENLSGIMVVRAFSNQKFQQKRFEEANKDLTENGLFVGRAMTVLMPTMMLVMNGVSLFIVWMGAGQIANSAIQIGDMMAFIQYAMQVIMSFLFIAMVFVMLPRAAVSAERIDEVLRCENSIKDPQNPQHFANGRARGEIVFNNVSFSYPGGGEAALQNINLSIKPGQTTAFIGATGSGKTTLVNLIPRFYDLSQGSISIDGIDVRELNQKELRQNIGYVPQKGLLFSGDIAHNLLYGNADADQETLQAAAEVAQAAEFIHETQAEYKAEVSQGGTNFSGGQRQRLSIARALVKKAPIYIFDDSFSALDFATDARLRAQLKPYTKDAAVLIVAQRVSTIMFAEQIVVLEDGEVAGIGTHKQLLFTCATYREIAQSQLSAEELA